MLKSGLLSLLAFAVISGAPAFAQESEKKQAEPVDEVISQGTIRTDRAMSAYLSGDFKTAEIEFKKNAFCALRATRNFRSGVEDARDSTLRADVGTAADTPSQPAGGQGGAFVPTTPTVAPTANVNSTDFQKDKSAPERTCADRGFQLYMTGLSQIKLGKFEDAKKSFKSATVHRKSIYDAYFRLALLEYQDGNKDKAKSQFRKLKSLQKKCRKCEFEKEIDEQVDYLASILG
jgi:Tfp pilus assembly protein PilF